MHYSFNLVEPLFVTVGTCIYFHTHVYKDIKTLHKRSNLNLVYRRFFCLFVFCFVLFLFLFLFLFFLFLFVWFFGNTPTENGYHPSLEFRYKALGSNDFGV